MAELFNMTTAGHGSVYPEINSHFVAAVPNGLMVPVHPIFCPVQGPTRFAEIYSSPIEAKNGYIKIPDKAGFGVELKENIVDKYTTKIY